MIKVYVIIISMTKKTTQCHHDTPRHNQKRNANLESVARRVGEEETRIVDQSGTRYSDAQDIRKIYLEEGYRLTNVGKEARQYGYQSYRTRTL